MSAAQAETEDKHTPVQRALAYMGPRFYFSQAEGYPGPIKWFLWLAMVFVYPVWIFVVLFGLAAYGVLYALLWVVFAPGARPLGRARTRRAPARP